METYPHQVQDWADALFDRPCFVCAAQGWCNHRELEVYQAMLSLAAAEARP